MKLRFRKLVAPLGVQLELTPFCSNNCFHCYNHWREEKISASSIMTRNEFLKAIDILAEAKIFYVTITGGEPLFVKPLWREILKKLASYDIGCNMNSNLVDIDDDSISLMKDCGLFSILTSFHSCNEITHDIITNNPGSFRKTLKNIQRLTESGLNISVNMVVTKQNFRDVYETCKLLKSVGVKYFNASRFQEPVRDKNFSSIKLTADEIKMAIKQLLAAEEDFGITAGSVVPYPFCFLANDKNLFRLAKKTCNAGITTASLEYTGFLRACPNSEIRYGHILSDGLQKCWEAMHLWREAVYVPSECGNCYYMPVCRGGCRAEGIKADKMNQKDSLMTELIKEKITGLSMELNRTYKPTDQFVIYNRIKYRKEDFGYTIVGPNFNSPAFISETVLKILLKFKDRKEILMKDFMDEWEIDLKDIYELFCQFEDKKIISRIGGR